LVSYVINGGPRPVSVSARERVVEAIALLGYRPDSVARNLRIGRSSSIGLVFPDIGLPYFGEITKHISKAATAAGQQLLLTDTDWSLDQERLALAGLADRRVDGIILMSVDPMQDFSLVDELGIPTVVVDRPTFMVDVTAAATRHLIEHGHTLIGLVCGASPSGVDRRRAGWQRTLAEAGLAACEEYVLRAGASRADGYEAAARALALDQPPTALVVESDAQGVGLLRYAKDRAIDIPDDLAVVTLEGTELGSFAIPSLTSIRQPMTEIATQAVTRVLERGGPLLRRVDVPEFELVVRESCGAH
jgi:LacI family transcriptional regulator